MTTTNFLQNMLVLLCQYFGNYDSNSNIGKFLDILANQMIDLETALNDSKSILNIDTATGANLDIFADNLQIIRGSFTDDELRARIKTEIRANFSTGDINTIREVAEVVLGEDALNGIIETYNSADFSNEIAGIALLLNTPSSNPINIPDETIERTVAAGIRIFYQLTNEVETIIIQEPNNYLDTVNFLESGTFNTSNELGVIL